MMGMIGREGSRRIGVGEEEDGNERRRKVER
jgi:hypothetical protein